jgi:hypothetical protein
MALSERERAILDLERTWWTEPGPKEELVKARFGVSTTRYYELLGALMETPEALEYDPLLVRRLRRSRERRRRARYERHSSADGAGPPPPSR